MSSTTTLKSLVVRLSLELECYQRHDEIDWDSLEIPSEFFLNTDRVQPLLDSYDAKFLRYQEAISELQTQLQHVLNENERLHSDKTTLLGQNSQSQDSTWHFERDQLLERLHQQNQFIEKLQNQIIEQSSTSVHKQDLPPFNPSIPEINFVSEKQWNEWQAKLEKIQQEHQDKVMHLRSELDSSHQIRTELEEANQILNNKLSMLSASVDEQKSEIDKLQEQKITLLQRVQKLEESNNILNQQQTESTYHLAGLLKRAQSYRNQLRQQEIALKTLQKEHDKAILKSLEGEIETENLKKTLASQQKKARNYLSEMAETLEKTVLT